MSDAHHQLRQVVTNDKGELAYASSAPSNAASPSANQLRQIVTNDKGELKFAALAPDVARSEKLSKAQLSKIVHLNNTTEEVGETRFLVAYDDRKEGELAFQFALRTAHAGDHVFLCQVLDINRTDAAYLESADVLQKMNDAVLKTLADKAAALVAKGIAVSVGVAHGDPKHALLALADFHRCTSIVLGRRKLGRLQKLISASSVSQYVLTHANQTVTIVKS